MTLSHSNDQSILLRIGRCTPLRTKINEGKESIAERGVKRSSVSVTRAPVLPLWAAVVAEFRV
jgi:hypothetical protein